MGNVPRCPRCGHNFYEGGSGICKWCQDEIDNPDYCYICGQLATCSSHNGTLCDNYGCHDKDDQITYKKYNNDNDY